MRLFEFGNFHTLPPGIPQAGLKAYLKEVWNNRHLFYLDAAEEEPLTEEQATELHRQEQALIRFDGPEIQGRNYAGFIQYKQLHLSVLPKIFKDKSFSTHTVFEHLLYYLSYGVSSRFPFSPHGLSTNNGENLLQLMIHWFAGYAEKTLTEKPYLAYHETQGATSFMQGKLDIPGYVRHTLSTGQWQDLYTRHAPFVYDNEFNRLVKYTALTLIPLAAGHSRSLLQSLLHILQEVSDKHFSYTDCDHIYINRLHEHQLTIRQMCRFFLASQSLRLPEGDSDYFSFLVPMERVFEEFIAGFIQRHFPGLQPEVQSVHELAKVAGKRISGIKNDIWLPGASVILDTKYKCIDSQPQDIFSQISQGDIYQMVAYAIRRNSTKVHLLYPQTGAEAADFTFEVTDALAAKTIHMHVHLVPVMVPDVSLLAGKSVAQVLTPLLKEKFAAILKSEPE